MSEEDESGAGGRPGPEDPGRRRALKIGIGVLGGGLVAIPAIPALGLVAFPLTTRVTSSGSGFITAGRRDAFTTTPVKVDLFADRKDAWNVTRDVKIGSAWVFEREGSLCAYSTVCPHLGCAIDFDASANEFSCPCHSSNFDLAGAPLGGPAPRSLDSLEVKEKDEDGGSGALVQIRYQRFKQNIADKVEV